MSPRQASRPPASRSKLKNVALFTEDADSAPTTVPLDKIILPSTQPRRYFDPKTMQSLVDSVKSDGILQPLLVRPVRDKYELVAGERRYKAAQSAGLTEVPVTVRQLTNEQAVQYALTENLQREDLNPVEEVEGILQLLALKLGTDSSDTISLLNKMAKVQRGLADNVVRQEEQQIVEDVFAAIGRLSPESFRAHRLPLLNLPDDILDALRQGQIEYTKAKEIAKLDSESERTKLLEDALAQNLTLSQIRERAKAFKSPTSGGEVQRRVEATYKQLKKSKVWDNPKKREKLESLLAEMEALMAESD
jgi:ParB family chromosome partitioning protein